MRNRSMLLASCRFTLGVAGFLVPEPARSEWKREWTSELWHRWSGMSASGEGSGFAAWRLYSSCLGAFADGWWHFTEDRSAMEHFSEKMRSPSLCLGSLGALLTLCLCVTGFLPATRMIFRPLPYANGDRIALVSRTGRMEAVRRGIPGALAQDWVNSSRSIRQLATCSFARKGTAAVKGRRLQAVSIVGTGNLFDVLGVTLESAPTGDGHSGVYLSYRFWKQVFHGDPKIVGITIELNGRHERIAGVLPERFWLLSPAVDIYELNAAALPKQALLVVECKAGVTAADIEKELEKTGDDNGYAFAATAPHAVFLKDALHAPLWLFGAALFIGAVLAALAHGSRLMRFNEAGEWFPRRSGRWWAFFLLKTSLALLLVLVVGLELFVGIARQNTSEALGGPALIWFYIVGCSGVLLASLADQRERCRVCQRLLAFPIRIGCPGCLLLDWAGTEFLCPQGHGMLYVPHHVACWEEEDRWILAEA